MKGIASIILAFVLMASCHHGDTNRPNEIKIAEDTARVEASRRAVTAPMPSQDSYIPPIPKKEHDICDTMKPKGGQNMIIAFNMSSKLLETLDDKSKMQFLSKSTEFQSYVSELSKEIPTGSGYFYTSACYIMLNETLYSTGKDKYGLILLKANGTYKIVPGVRTNDEWRETIGDFFDGK